MELGKSDGRMRAARPEDGEVAVKLSRSVVVALSCLVLAISALVLAQPALAAKPAPGSLGMNLSTLDSASTQIPFVDIFKQSSRFEFQKKWTPPNTKPPSPPIRSAIDENGWVVSLAYDEQAIACMFNNNSGYFPAGTYTLHYNGQGEFQIYGGTIRERGPNRLKVDIDPRRMSGWKNLCVVETRTDPNDPIRNIRFILPGFDNTYEQDPWYPPFLERLRPFGVIRFMDWQVTNLNIDVDWSDRKKISSATQASPIGSSTAKGLGVALEYQIDLANRLESDPWFNIPATASDDYIRQMATLVKERLHPGLHPAIELSNEVFNNFPASYDYALQMGTRLNLPSPPGENVVYGWYALRASQMFDIWNGVFGVDAGRIIHVVTGRRVAPAVNDFMLQYGDLYKKTDVLAIDGYMFPFNKWEPPIRNGRLKWSDVAVLSTKDVLAAMHNYIDERLVPSWIEAAKVAQKFGVGLVVYEGGESNVTAFQTDDERVTRLFISTSRDPGMSDVYAHLLNAWSKMDGAGLFSQYDFVGLPNKFGCWGALEYQDQDPKTAPKYSALAAYAARRILPAVPPASNSHSR
jgi:hypothetical protein